MGDRLTEGRRRVVRIHVEPVELELEADDSLLVTSLQSALPGASGLYFNGEYKTAVKFDGTKLVPPTDGWQNRTYYATLGTRCFDYPFGSYTNASKQFEKSVNAVERMLGNGGIFGAHLAKEKPLRKGSSESDKAENMKQLFASMSQRRSAEAAGGEERRKPPSLSPLEKQFVDLARISTAKDTIIEQQRTDIKILEEKTADNERALKDALENLSKAEEQCTSLENEMALLKALSKEQVSLGNQVTELRQTAQNSEEVIQKQMAKNLQLQDKIQNMELEKAEVDFKARSLQADLLAALKRSKELEAQLEEYESQTQLRQTQADAETERCEGLHGELRATREQNQKLSSDLSIIEEKYKHLNEIFSEISDENAKLKARCREVENQLEKRRRPLRRESNELEGQLCRVEKENEDLRKELATSDEKLEDLSRMVDSLTREATCSEDRAKIAEKHSEDLQRQLKQMEAKSQELPAEEVRESENLRVELQQAQDKIEELTLLLDNIKSFGS